MKKLLNKFISIFIYKEITNFYSIKELKDLRKKEMRNKMKKKNREYISELNKKQKLWLIKNSRISRNVL